MPDREIKDLANESGQKAGQWWAVLSGLRAGNPPGRHAMVIYTTMVDKGVVRPD